MPLPVPVAVAAVVLGAVAGGLTGLLTHQWLAWLRRGAHVRATWCVLGLGGLWGGAVAAWVVGALPVAALPLTLGLGWLVVAGSAVDLAVHRLPDALTIPAAPILLVLLVPLGVDAVTRGALAGIVLCSVHAVVRLVAPVAMGGGDVKLAAGVGACLGGMSWSALVVGTVLACLLTALAGALRLGIAAHRDRAPPEPRLADAARTGAVPHGPSMVIACLVVVGIASTGPVVPVPGVEPASVVVLGRAGDGESGGRPVADMTARASPWPVARPRVRG